jgi:hypothetical protein
MTLESVPKYEPKNTSLPRTIENARSIVEDDFKDMVGIIQEDGTDPKECLIRVLTDIYTRQLTLEAEAVLGESSEEESDDEPFNPFVIIRTASDEKELEKAEKVKDTPVEPASPVPQPLTKEIGVQCNIICSPCGTGTKKSPPKKSTTKAVFTHEPECFCHARLWAEVYDRKAKKVINDQIPEKENRIQVWSLPNARCSAKHEPGSEFCKKHAKMKERGDPAFSDIRNEPKDFRGANESRNWGLSSYIGYGTAVGVEFTSDYHDKSAGKWIFLDTEWQQ